MRLAFVSPYYRPYAVGGAEESTAALAEALAARGHDVRLLTLRLGPVAPPTGVPVETIDVGLDLEAPGKPIRRGAWDGVRLQARIASAVARAARSADIVHCQTLHLLPGAFAGARRAGAPIVATIRDFMGVCPVAVCLHNAARVPRDCSVLKLERECVPRFHELYGGSIGRLRPAALVGFATARGRSALLRRCDAVVSVSADTADLYADAGLIDREGVVVIPNIVEAAGDVGPAPHGEYALFVGRASPGKGVGMLLEAVEIARRSAPDLRLVVAGYATPFWRRRLQSTEGVEYLGHVDSTRMGAVYAGARLAVVPSVTPEPLGRCALEAAAAGLPVVASAVGGLPEVVVDGITGRLVPPRDAVSLAAALLEFWSDAALRTRLGGAARKQADEHFSPDAVASRAEALYDRLAGSSRS